MDKRWMTLLLAMLLAATALAGCAQPEEAEEDTVAEEEALGEEGAAGEEEEVFAEEQEPEEERVMIDGFVYECDTFMETEEVEGVCDEYQLDEGADTAAFEGEQFESDGEMVVINDRTYHCDDDFAEPEDPPCEEWVIDPSEE